MEGLGVTSRSVQELPSVRAVEAPNLNRLQDFRVEVPQVDTVVSTRFGVQRFPVRSASACCATHGPECFVTLNVLLGFLRMTGNPHSAELVVGPEGTQAPADGTVAVRGLLRGSRQLDRDSAAVAGSNKHGVL